jgi:hypothetical protein
MATGKNTAIKIMVEVRIADETPFMASSAARTAD